MVKTTTAIVLLAALIIFGETMQPENEKQYLLDTAAAYRLSTTKTSKALAKAAEDAASRIVIPTTTQPPVVTPPSGPTFPLNLINNPTGPKKPLPIAIGNVTTTVDGQTIDGINATVINIKHNNVTIRNFQAASIQKEQGKTGLVLEDGKIDGQNIYENAVQWSDYTCRRVEITRTTDAFKAHGNITIEQCWVHDLNFQTGSTTGAGGYSHNDGVQVSSGTSITVTGSRFENMKGNGGVFVDPDQGPISNVLIENNFFTNVGNYPIYIKESASNPSTGLPTNVTVKNNTIGQRRTDTDPTWGPMLCEIRANNLAFSGNKTLDGQTIKLDSSGKGYL